MKKTKVMILFSLILMIFIFTFNMVYAERKDTPIKKVEVYDIDYPYENGSVLDTSTKITDSSYSIVKDVSWENTGAGLYRVTVTVRPYIYYFYDENTTATLNGNNAEVSINEDENLEITYTFPKDESVILPNSEASLKHAIMVYKPTNGTISPSTIRAPHNKNFTVQIIPDDGYRVKDVIVDGDSVGAVTEYTFRKVTETHKIRAVFEKIENDTNNHTDVSDSTEEFKLFHFLNSIIDGIVQAFRIAE
ncbi:MAG: hypothetical protein IJ215_05570 [Clostridia bacterium]|nr:hypothetical protein [Clostridia bacterium]